MLHFLHRCRQRLDALGFDQRGAVYQAIDKAYSAVFDLHTTLHYASCGRGVGKSSDEPPETAPSIERADRVSV